MGSSWWDLQDLRAFAPLRPQYFSKLIPLKFNSKFRKIRTVSFVFRVWKGNSEKAKTAWPEKKHRRRARKWCKKAGVWTRRVVARARLTSEKFFITAWHAYGDPCFRKFSFFSAEEINIALMQRKNRFEWIILDLSSNYRFFYFMILSCYFFIH